MSLSQAVSRTDAPLKADGLRFTLVASRFNALIVEPLVAGACDCLIRHGARADDLHVIWVPGAWELSQMLARLLRRYEAGLGIIPDGIIALGAVIKGSTAHFDYVAGEAAHGAGAAGRTGLVPVTFGVLTCDSIEQALERAGTKHGNKGAEAAMAAMEMAQLFRAFPLEGPAPLVTAVPPVEMPGSASHRPSTHDLVARES